MAIVEYSPRKGTEFPLLPSVKTWFEEFFPSKAPAASPHVIPTAIFDKADIVDQLIGAQGSQSLIFSKRSHEGTLSLAAAGIKGGNLLTFSSDKLFWGSQNTYPTHHADFSATDILQTPPLPKPDVEPSPGNPIQYYQLLSTAKTSFREVIKSLQSWQAIGSVNFFLSVTFPSEDIQALADGTGCERIAFIPMFMLRVTEEVADRNVVLKTIQVFETLGAFPLDSGDQFIFSETHRPLYSTNTWPINYPPYSGA